MLSVVIQYGNGYACPNFRQTKATTYIALIFLQK